METVKADDDVKKLLMDMKLIDSDEMFNQVLENDKVKNDIYGYIEKVGGIKRARQSIRQPPPQPSHLNSNRPAPPPPPVGKPDSGRPRAPPPSGRPNMPPPPPKPTTGNRP